MIRFLVFNQFPLNVVWARIYTRPVFIYGN